MTVTLTSRSGADGRVRLEIPMHQPHRDYQVEVTVREAEAFALPSNYFDVLGTIADATFERPPQGELPAAVDYE
ncbi:hypothetical protein BH11PLA2_BH11PLA2_51970 [soil metagenome]